MTNPDPATVIAQQWYIGRNISYDGVNLGECMTYDALQVVNRILINNKPKEKKVVMDMVLK